MIAGGGVIGLSLAWRLSQKNVAVTVIDAGRAGGEASWAAAGMLAPGGEMARENDWTRFTLESHRAYAAFTAELAEESGIDPEYRVCGAIQLADTDSEWQRMTVRAALQQRMGIASEIFDSSQLRSVVPGLAEGDWRGRYYAGDALVNPRRLTQALRTACEKRGVEIIEQTAVLRISRDHVDTASQAFPMDAAIIAAGAWSGNIALAEPRPVTRPIRGHLNGYQLPPGTLAPIVRHGHTYLLQRASGLVIAGSSEERVGFDRNIDPALAQSIHQRAVRILPQLAHLRHETWIGFRPGTASGHPVLRRAGERVWLAYGHYRNGILQAPGTASRIASEMLDCRNALVTSPSAA